MGSTAFVLFVIAVGSDLLLAHSLVNSATTGALVKIDLILKTLIFRTSDGNNYISLSRN